MTSPHRFRTFRFAPRPRNAPPLAWERFVVLVHSYGGFIDGSFAYFPKGNRAAFVAAAREARLPIRA
jgi:hypothetical protein